jgi:hypothetical protein
MGDGATSNDSKNAGSSLLILIPWVKAMTTFFDIMYAAHGQRCLKPLGRALLPTVNRRAPQTAEIRYVLMSVHCSTSPLCTYTAEISFLCAVPVSQEYVKPTVHAQKLHIYRYC